MKRILTIVFLLSIIAANAQRSVTGDTLKIYGGGSFEGAVVLDTNQIKQLDTATNDYDGVPFFQIMDSINNASGSNFWTLTGNYLYPDNTTDSVGIGVTSPDAILDVGGRIEISNTGGSVFIGEGAGLNDDLSNNYNVFIGKSAGNSNTDGDYNIGIGVQSQYHSVSAGENVSIGFMTLYNNYSGKHNTAIGNESMGSALGAADNDGSYNTAMGWKSLYSINLGSYNVGVGGDALQYITDGNYNIGIGYNTGRYYGSGTDANETGTYNIFLGYDTRASEDGTTNEIAIGAGAIANGSNTATILDDNGTDVYMGEDGQCNVHLNGIYDTNGEIGTSGQILASTGSAADWVNQIDTTRIYDSLAVHLDTLQALRSDINTNTPDSINFKADFSNISQIQFIVGKDTITTSGDHEHNEIMSRIDDIEITASDTSLFEQTVDSAYLKTATDIGMQNKKIVNLADPTNNQDAMTLGYMNDTELNITGDVVASWDISATGSATIQSDAVEGSMLNDNVISGQTELTTGVEEDDEILISDDGTIKRISLENLQKLGKWVKTSTTSLTALQVNSLGTQFTLLSAPGSGYYYKIFGIDVLITPTTQLEVGIQKLVFNFTSGVGAGPWGYLTTAQVESSSTLLIDVDRDNFYSNNLYLGDNQAFWMQLNDGTNPTSGSATMRVRVYYTIETY